MGGRQFTSTELVQISTVSNSEKTLLLEGLASRFSTPLHWRDIGGNTLSRPINAARAHAVSSTAYCTRDSSDTSDVGSQHHLDSRDDVLITGGDCTSEKSTADGSITADDAPLQADSIDADDALLQSDNVTADDAPLQADNIDTDAAPLQADNIDTDAAPLQADSTNADDAPLQADSIDTDDAPLQADSIAANDAPLQADSMAADDAPLQADSIDADDATRQADRRIAYTQCPHITDSNSRRATTKRFYKPALTEAQNKGNTSFDIVYSADEMSVYGRHVTGSRSMTGDRHTNDSRSIANDRHTNDSKSMARDRDTDDCRCLSCNRHTNDSRSTSSGRKNDSRSITSFYSRSTPTGDRYINDSRSIPKGDRFITDSRSIPTSDGYITDSRSIPTRDRYITYSRSVPTSNRYITDSRSIPTSDRHITDSRSIPTGDRHITDSRSIPTGDRHITDSRSIPTGNRHITETRSIPTSDRYITDSRNIPTGDRHITDSRSIVGDKYITDSRSIPGDRLKLVAASLYEKCLFDYVQGKRDHSSINDRLAVDERNPIKERRVSVRRSAYDKNKLTVRQTTPCDKSKTDIGSQLFTRASGVCTQMPNETSTNYSNGLYMAPRPLSPSPLLLDSPSLFQQRGIKRKTDANDEDLFVGTDWLEHGYKRFSPFANTPRERKEERRKLFRMSFTKMKLIENPEHLLRRSVLIRNVMRKIQEEIRAGKLLNSVR